MIKDSLICFGSGNCTKIPCTLLSSFNLSIALVNVSSVTSSSNLIKLLLKPTSSQFFILLATYVSLAPLFPIKIAAKCGVMPVLFLCKIVRALICSFAAFDTTFPSKICICKSIKLYPFKLSKMECLSFKNNF